MAALKQLAKLKRLLDGRSRLGAWRWIDMPVMRRALGMWHMILR